jgi:hypothetical protein
MYGSKSSFPADGPWNGLDGLSPQSQYQREVDGNPPPTGQDISQIIDEVIAAQNGVLDVHQLACQTDTKVDSVKSELEAKIEEVKKMPGPKGDPGESIKGDPGESIKGDKGDPGESIKGDKGDPGETPTVEIISETEIKIGDKTIILPRGPQGKPGKAPVVRRPIVGGTLGGFAGTPGQKGDKGDPGSGGGGVQTAEVDSNCVVGQPLFIRANTHAELAQADAGSTIAVGLSNSDTLANHAVEYLTDSSITQDDWSNVIEDGSPSLTIGVYFLSLVAGKITPVCPTTGYIQRVGRALSPTCLDIEITGEIKL